ncbi:FtsQ-type POTRA domain-containing protein [Novosphingobium sp. FSY-8]|uniref:Cell division protein FtsQ n=1 Tax=Novosphingobium ovatum TaxID=1908523 RepID=A0ABW9XE85_9SPHN|nr:cell division protein FtsQ/DivIB [Novosphingobium ovatum]NBC36850.1 FtsQ-type POTRA domain-containing protein [Novosphingobium ovatum]
MSQKLKRGGTNARRTAARAQSARKVQAAKARTGSALDQAMALVPVSEKQLYHFLVVLILTVSAVLAWVVASLMGLPEMVQQHVTHLTAQAGFEVRKVVVHGVKHQNELAIYDRVDGVLEAQHSRSMAAVDLPGLRDQILALPWVAEARVSRQLPDTLVIEIEERKAHAVLRVRDAEGSHLSLIDATGRELEPVSEADVKGRLVLAGDGVGTQVAALAQLMEAAPAIRPQVAEAEWVGHRRWNLTFRNKKLLELPEGDGESSKALMAFARMDGTLRLMDREYVVFDMRVPPKIYMRKPGTGEGGEADGLAQGGAGAAPVAQESGQAGAVAAAPLAAVARVALSEPRPSEKPADKPRDVAKPKDAPKKDAPKKDAAKPKDEPKAKEKPKVAPKGKEKPKDAPKDKARPKDKPKAEPAHRKEAR